MHFLSKIIFVVTVVSLTSCDNQKYIGNLSDYPGEKQGLLQSYLEDGSLNEMAKFEEGLLHGYRKIFYRTGELEIEESYNHGTFHGRYTKYYKNSKAKVSGDYVNGSMEGSWKTYYESGAVKDEVVMHDNLENGPFIEYHENGIQQAVGTYKNGEFEEGLLQLFDSSGTLIKKMDCQNGICHTLWTKETVE